MTEMQATELIEAVKLLAMVIAVLGLIISIGLAALNVTISRK